MHCQSIFFGRAEEISNWAYERKLTHGEEMSVIDVNALTSTLTFLATANSEH